MLSTGTSCPREELNCSSVLNQCSESALGRKNQVRTEGSERWRQLSGGKGWSHITTEAMLLPPPHSVGDISRKQMEAFNSRVFTMGGTRRVHLVPSCYIVQEAEALRLERASVGKLETHESQWCCTRLRPVGWILKKFWCFSLSAKAGKKNDVFSVKSVRQEGFPLTHGRISCFVLFRLSTDWRGLTHIREDNLFDSV